MPVLLFGSEIWAADIVDKVQNDLFSFKTVTNDCDRLTLQFYKKNNGSTTPDN